MEKLTTIDRGMKTLARWVVVHMIITTGISMFIWQTLLAMERMGMH